MSEHPPARKFDASCACGKCLIIRSMEKFNCEEVKSMILVKASDVVENRNAVTKLELEVKRLRDGLGFYSNPENWTRRESMFHECIDRADCKDYPHITRDVRMTGGHKARQILSEIDQGKVNAYQFKGSTMKSEE